jgi:hypothetical protein
MVREARRIRAGSALALDAEVADADQDQVLLKMSTLNEDGVMLAKNVSGGLNLNLTKA